MSLKNTTLYPEHIALTSKTSAQWTSSNPVLLAGEIGIESDTLRMKAGDGTTKWKVLQYTDTEILKSIAQLESRITELENMAQAIMTTITSVIKNIMRGEVNVK